MIKKGNLSSRKTAENQEKNVLPEKTGRFAGKKKPPRGVFYGPGGGERRFGQGKRPVLRFAGSLKAAVP